MPKTDISITDEQVQGFIAKQMQTGDYDSPDEVVTDAVRRVVRAEEKRAEWEAMIDEGIAQAERGDTVNGATYRHERISRLNSGKP